MSLGDLRPGPLNSSPEDFAEFDGKIYFVAHHRLWSTNGIENDATEVTTPFPAEASRVGASDGLLVVNTPFGPDSTVYSTTDPSQGFDPVTVDSAVSIDFEESWGVGDRVAAIIDDPTPGKFGNALLVIDGTSSEVISFGDDQTYVYGDEVVSHRDRLYLAANDAAEPQLWISDGTSAGTAIVQTADEENGNDLEGLTTIGDRLYYYISTAAFGGEAHWLDASNGFTPSPGFLPLTPARLYESRPGQTTVDGQQQGGDRVAAGSVTEIQVAGRGGVPTDAEAVSLNVTIVGPEGGGFATIFPCGVTTPTASNINYTGGDINPNAALSKIGTGGKVCVYTLAQTHLIVDVNGAFEAN